MNDRKIAVLIDADNISDKYINIVLDELTKYGTPTYKRIYGDWTSPNMASWKGVLLAYSIIPIQQYSYTTGKNSTDSALIIDAMDILYSGNVDSFCIVSSDSDFTRLATRLREAGMYVIGMGEQKTPKPFISACESFKYLDVLLAPPDAEQTKCPTAKSNSSKGNMVAAKTIKKALRAIIEETSEEDGWAALGGIGSVLSKRYPDFDARNYGHTKLSLFVSSLGDFEVTQRKSGNSGGMNVYVRNKK